jgi:hypothetical protein
VTMTDERGGRGGTLSRVSNSPYLYILYATLYELWKLERGGPSECVSKTSASEFKNVRLFYPIRLKYLSFY